MVSRCATVGILVGLPLAVAAATAPGCKSDSKALGGVAHPCSLNTECDSPLACIFGRCHSQCKVSNDCPTDQRCVMGASAALGTAVVHVCQLPNIEDTCRADAGGTCHGAQTCGGDLQCRDSCGAALACLGNQSCVNGACFDPSNHFDQGFLDGGGAGGEEGSVDATPSDASAEGGNDGAADGAVSDDSIADSATLDAPSTEVADGSKDAFVPNTNAGGLGFVPSNFNTLSFMIGDGGFDWSSAPAASATGNGGCGANTGCFAAPHFQVLMKDGGLADVLMLQSLSIGDGVAFTISGPNPVILAVRDTVDIAGELVVEAGGFLPKSNAPGTGGSETGNLANAGGGGFCGAGGKGGPPTVAGGKTYGNGTLIPLLGGSPGGASAGGSGGASGGGALQISAGQMIAIGIFGSVTAPGQSPHENGGLGGGPGSGGGILLEAPMVKIVGSVAANGGSYCAGASNRDQPATCGPSSTGATPGAGSAETVIQGGDAMLAAGAGAGATGAGGGGAGWIRINTESGQATITGIVSPALTTQCATQGTLSR